MLSVNKPHLTSGEEKGKGGFSCTSWRTQPCIAIRYKERTTSIPPPKYLANVKELADE